MAEHTVYAVASGKGGVGKTTTTVNLGAALAEQGYSVVLVDVDLGMANLGGYLDVDADQQTLHEVLGGEATLEDAVYDVADGLAVVPSGTSLGGFADVETDELSGTIDALSGAFDYVLLDLGAGLSHDSVLPLALADAVLLVTTPQPLSLQDTGKTREITERLGGAVAGTVLTRARSPGDVDLDDVEDEVGIPVLSVIPEDQAVQVAADDGRPVVGHDPDSPAAEGYRGLAEIVIEESLAKAPVVPEAAAVGTAAGSPTDSTGEVADAEPEPQSRPEPEVEAEPQVEQASEPEREAAELELEVDSEPDPESGSAAGSDVDADAEPPAEPSTEAVRSDAGDVEGLTEPEPPADDQSEGVPSETEPPEAEPSTEEPPEAEPSGTEPSGSEATETEVTEAEPAEEEPPEAEPAEEEPPEAEPAEEEPATGVPADEQSPAGTQPGAESAAESSGTEPTAEDIASAIEEAAGSDASDGVLTVENDSNAQEGPRLGSEGASGEPAEADEESDGSALLGGGESGKPDSESGLTLGGSGASEDVEAEDVEAGDVGAGDVEAEDVGAEAEEGSAAGEDEEGEDESGGLLSRLFGG